MQVEPSEAQKGLKRSLSLDAFAESFWDINLRFFPLVSTPLSVMHCLNLAFPTQLVVHLHTP